MKALMSCKFNDLKQKFHKFFLVKVYQLAVHWCVSLQVVVILISIGLEGDTSARTLMWMQAVMDMAKRAQAIFLPMCANLCEQKGFVFY